jgi:hypothetical protein
LQPQLKTHDVHHPTLIVVVAAFNLVSTPVMTVTDKRADIAILRTLGASPRASRHLRGARRHGGRDWHAVGLR